MSSPLNGDDDRRRNPPYSPLHSLSLSLLDGNMNYVPSFKCHTDPTPPSPPIFDETGRQAGRESRTRGVSAFGLLHHAACVRVLLKARIYVSYLR